MEEQEIVDDVPVPAFIIGSPRSGTTLLRVMLDSHPYISSGPETHFLVDLHRLAEAHAAHIEFMGFDQQWWRNHVRSFYTAVQCDYMRRRGKRRWVEKTPAYTLHLDFLDDLFPDARYIHIIRDGRDVVASHADRWGYRSALHATSTWGQYVQAARRFGRRAPTRYHEIRYESLVTDPEESLKPLLAFLDEPWDASVLAFEEQDHDVSRFVEFTASRRAEGGQQKTIYTSRVGAGSKQLDPLLRTLLTARSGALLRELGYLS